MSHVQKWWKEGVVYQIYPASYADSNGDGTGDIPGIISKLDHIKNLGVTIIWVSPFYKSPQYDLGYDIADYKDVHEPYGTVADVERLIEGCHSRGLKVIFDLVINHTSHQHEWFQESKKDKTNPKRDWYMWRPPKVIDGVNHPPNNWRGCFGGSVWEWDETTQEYYLHYFCVEQPDVNWENPALRQALYEDAVKFWLDKGADGFRIDTSNMYSKFLDFPDAEVVDKSTPWQPAGNYFCNGPRLHEFLQEMHEQTFSKYDCVTIGELPNTPELKDILAFVSAKNKEFNMVIQFDLADLDHGRGVFHLMRNDWKLSAFKDITVKSQEITDFEHDAWATTYLENHDQGRSIPRYASDSPEHRVNSAKMLATYLLTLSGTPIIYQGEEIGMINCPKDWSIEEEYKDISTQNQIAEIKKYAEESGDKNIVQLAREGIQITARDHARTPMQWSSEANAGFSTNSNTWMRVMDSYTEINVADQENDPDSVLAYYRKATALRKAHKNVFAYGQFKLYGHDNEETMIYSKRAHKDHGNTVAFVALNFTDKEQTYELPSDLKGEEFELVLGNGKSEGPLGPFEARVFLSK